ncbi:MAG: thiamine-monophosphate kinase [Candidatus Geothermarchaeales archaeon]
MTREKPLSEREIIQTMGGILFPEGWAPDDVASLQASGEGRLVCSTDSLVASTDVPSSMSLFDASRKAAVSVVSDFASKGVQVEGMLFSLSLPPAHTRKDIENLARGLRAASQQYGFTILAADTNEARDLVVNCTGFGFTTRDIPGRGSASPGDIVLTTGLFGLSPLGLHLAKRDLRPESEVEVRASDAFLSPTVKVESALKLVATGHVTSSMDSSDGLLTSLYDIAEASDVKITMDGLPTYPGIEEAATKHGLDLQNLVLAGGEEYESIFTVSPAGWEEAQRLIQEGSSYYRIGEAGVGKGVYLRENSSLRPLRRRGWEHLRRRLSP